jgi:hypothetical protein
MHGRIFDFPFSTPSRQISAEQDTTTEGLFDIAPLRRRQLQSPG